VKNIKGDLQAVKIPFMNRNNEELLLENIVLRCPFPDILIRRFDCFHFRPEHDSFTYFMDLWPDKHTGCSPQSASCKSKY
jgi:hypothetical protein